LARLGIWGKPILLIGAGQTAELLVNHYFCDPAIGYRLLGILEDQPWERPLCRNIPYLGRFADAEAIIRATGIQEVVVTAPGLGKEQLLELIYKLQRCTRRVSFVPDLIGIPLSNIEMDTVFSERTLLLHVRNNLSEAGNRFCKRLMDMVIGSLILLAVSPVMLLIAAAIRLESVGAPVFVHRRIGRRGSSFPCLKFRTMVRDADQVLAALLAADPAAQAEWSRDFKLRHDPRVTRVGRFLRATSLDELPQLLNVLAGQMSLVGPRPIIREEIAKYGAAIEDYYMVRPGLTGLWQVSGRNDVSYEQRVEMDSWYVRNWSPWFDLTLLFRTLAVVMAGKGAY
jgi:undecaprenyl-phosphate galactose phosphotransferase